MTVAVALAAALVSIVAAVAAYLTLRRACATARTLDDEIRRGKAAFDGVIAAEVERRAADLERSLALAREGHCDAEGVPAYVEREFRRYLGCGIPPSIPTGNVSH